MKILVTGGCGFIGSNFIRYFLKSHPDYSLINVDKLTYAGNLANLSDVSHSPHYHFIRGDIADAPRIEELINKGIDAIVNFAAESHVDRSIEDPSAFIKTNVFGTFALLEAVRKLFPKQRIRFLHISTDEVYGTLGLEGIFTEETPFRPNSPYAASKAGADLLVRSYFETYHFPVLIVRPSNNYGPYQFPEKFIPLMVTNLLDGKKVPVYGRGENVRDWLFVEDACRAVSRVLERGRPGEAYNAGGESEKRNIDLARVVLAGLVKGEEWLEYVTDRPGHDLRYALSNAKIRKEIGWEPVIDFSAGLSRTVRWYQEHPDWWRPLKARLARESQGFWSK